MPETTFYTTFSTSHIFLSRAKNGYESGFRSAVSYRFGFNGQEMDNEITGQTGTHTTAMFWEYDARLGRRWNIDPVVKEFESPYLCFSGNPIWLVDINGADTSFADAESRQNFLETYDDVSNNINEQTEHIETLSKVLMNDNLSDVQRDVIEKNIVELNTEREKMMKIKSSFDDVINAETMFYYNAKPNPFNSQAGAQTMWDKENNRFEISFYVGNKRSIVHESTHGQQRLNGNLGIYDYMDEFDAFSAAEYYGETILKIPALPESEIKEVIEINYKDQVQSRQWFQSCRDPKYK